MKKSGKRITGLICACIFSAVFSSVVMSLDVPAVIELGSLSDRFEAVTFDHGTHTLIAGDCGVCHHEHGTNSGFPCKDCHDVAPETFRKSVSNTFMACSMCHGDFDRDMAHVPGLKAAYHRKCFKCHRGIGNLGLDPQGCTEMCHAAKSPEKSAKARDSFVPFI